MLKCRNPNVGRGNNLGILFGFPDNGQEERVLERPPARSGTDETAGTSGVQQCREPASFAAQAA